ERHRSQRARGGARPAGGDGALPRRLRHPPHPLRRQGGGRRALAAPLRRVLRRGRRTRDRRAGQRQRVDRTDRRRAAARRRGDRRGGRRPDPDRDRGLGGQHRRRRPLRPPRGGDRRGFGHRDAALREAPAGRRDLRLLRAGGPRRRRAAGLDPGLRRADRHADGAGPPRPHAARDTGRRLPQGGNPPRPAGDDRGARPCRRQLARNDGRHGGALPPRGVPAWGLRHDAGLRGRRRARLGLGGTRAWRHGRGAAAAHAVAPAPQLRGDVFLHHLQGGAGATRRDRLRPHPGAGRRCARRRERPRVGPAAARPVAAAPGGAGAGGGRRM
ncbi:MAG: hypothetical protein AVDCRST_MAG88-2167, partial [uncultured Thermomicrobiales bacterium]